MKHYTQQRSELMASRDLGSGILSVRGGGFVTRQMLEQALDQLQASAEGRGPRELLVDLRDVAGYEAGIASQASEWLETAARCGIRKIAFIASSSVLRTAAQLVSRSTRIKLRMFEFEHSARSWLGQPTGSHPLVSDESAAPAAREQRPSA